MAKKKKEKRGGFPEAKANPNTASGPADGPQRRWGLIFLFLVISIGGTYLALWLRPSDDAARFTYKVIKKYDHDPKAFTQGLEMRDGFLWESTGRYGESSIRKTELSGKVLINKPLDESMFGEGLTYLDGKFYQLTWKAGKALVYDKELNVVDEFEYEGEGWGLTNDGTHLIFSDGSREIKFLDPETFKPVRSIWVQQPSRRSVGQLNELEYYQGKIYANRYQSDFVYEIDPENGDVTKIINLRGIWKQRPADGVLNGIAVNEKSGKLLVTGKLCPYVFEVNLVPEQRR